MPIGSIMEFQNESCVAIDNGKREVPYFANNNCNTIRRIPTKRYAWLLTRSLIFFAKKYVIDVVSKR